VVRQATLVAFYGPKRGAPGRLLSRWQDRLGRSVRELGAGIQFRPYPLPQIHATILGLERLPRPGLYNRNLHDFEGALQEMRLAELFAFMRETDHLPFEAQFGGFENAEYPFRSRGARPHHRSFSIQDGTAVVVGWPARAAQDRKGDPNAEAYPLILDELRRSARRFNVLHRWHRAPSDVDNDLYLRLGLLDGELAESERHLVEDEMRRALGESPPALVPLAAGDLAIVSYPADEETLPIARSKAVPLADPRLRDERFVAELYS
jgi:hypothetical protein